MWRGAGVAGLDDCLVQTHVVGKPSLKALRDETPQDFTPRPYNQETDIDPDALHYLYLMVKTPPSKA
jgi:hypothetical protein